MQTVAATGTIATTEDTRKLCEGYFTFRSIGPTRVKGVSEAVNVHEVTGLGPLRTRLQAVIFEDLHWLDEGSWALLNLLADSIGTARVLMLVNYRPEFTHNWGNKTYYTQLRLDPLGVERAKRCCGRCSTTATTWRRSSA